MRRQIFLRTFLFFLFFSIGSAALSVSVLSWELLQYHRNKRLLKQAQASLNRLESLNADYDALLERLQKEPDVVKHIAPAALGSEPADEDTVYPKATAEQLAAAKEALTEDLSWQSIEPMVPDWVVRCSEPGRRFVLFVAGAFLIIVSFVCFRTGSGRDAELLERQ